MLLIPSLAYAARIKDLAVLEGARDNQLIGYGLVVGLNGTGDKSGTIFTTQTLTNLLANMGLQVTGNIEVKDVAAVMVTATLGPYSKPGDKADAVVSALGDSQSLQGGTLLMTQLKGPDQKVYAIAQGQVSLGGGFSAEGASGSVQKNHPTVGRVVSGAIIERGIEPVFLTRDEIRYKLRNPDFTTASRLADVLNGKLDGNFARPLDASTVELRVPDGSRGNIVAFLAGLEGLDVEPDFPAKVVLNEKTGTVVMGDTVRLSQVAVSQGNLTIEINTETTVSQPKPQSSGQTVTAPKTDITAKEQKAHLIVLEGGTSLGQVVKALNAVGTTPRDLIAILQALKAAGALQADLEII